jgi:hypothetical protein
VTLCRVPALPVYDSWDWTEFTSVAVVCDYCEITTRHWDDNVVEIVSVTPAFVIGPVKGQPIDSGTFVDELRGQFSS